MKIINIKHATATYRSLELVLHRYDAPNRVTLALICTPCYIHIDNRYKINENY